MRPFGLLVAGMTLLLLTAPGFAKTSTVKCKDGTSATAGRDACKDHGGVERVPLGKRKEGATAKCNDGTYWHSTAHSGACLHHHGVAEWYGTPLGT